MQNIDRLILRKLCEISSNVLSLNPNGSTESIHYDWENACAADGTSLKVRYGFTSTGVVTAPTYYLLDGTPYTGALGECTSNSNLESDGVPYCDNGVSIIRWYVKENGVPNGEVYDTDLDNNILPFSSTATIGDCINSQPGIHLIQNVTDGTYASPFLANCVTVSYDTTVPGVEEITVELIGSVSGNKIFKVYGNNQEQLCFDSKVIQGVIITGVTTGLVDIEFKSK